MSDDRPNVGGPEGSSQPSPLAEGVARPGHLRDAVSAVMSDADLRDRYPDGLSGGDVLTEIRAKYGPDAWPLVSVLDVIDELRELYR